MLLSLKIIKKNLKIANMKYRKNKIKNIIFISKLIKSSFFISDFFEPIINEFKHSWIIFNSLFSFEI